MRSILLTLLLLLPACLDMSDPPPPPALSFRQYLPIYLKVSKIDVLEEYQSPGRAPNVEHLMPYSPADAMQLWSKQRLKASGGDKTMQVIIRDAGVVEKPLPRKEGVSGLLTVEPDRQYNARLEVEIRIYGDAALSEASVNVVATRALTVSENVSPRERDAKFRELIRDMMATFNAELEKNINQHLANYVDYARMP